MAKIKIDINEYASNQPSVVRAWISTVDKNMFFTVRLINRKIYDFKMMEKAMRAFETFVL